MDIPNRAREYGALVDGTKPYHLDCARADYGSTPLYRVANAVESEGLSCLRCGNRLASGPTTL